MKILRITANNIASLAGTQSVDFTREPLKSAGLFGISGPTGAGKTSLLDAMCLALFDTTPRLRQVGNLEEINSGERQNNSRTLLRRGTASGFAEVAFVGVDQQIWTARWSVRRSRNRAGGKLQPAEMTLYRGNITPGEEGPVESGGKKTLVQQAIVEKIGLTFEQFTRAVLLAQNEFAAFLKAGDKERAEILQALTGTERFEVISRAVFARCSEEKQKLEQIQSLLSGSEPLSTEDRVSAEDALDAATQSVQLAEQQLTETQSHAAWFESHKQRTKEISEATEQLQQAKARQQETAEKRRELEHTQIVQREAATLWNSHQEATTAFKAAEENVVTARAALQSKTEQFQQATKELDAARITLQQIVAEQAAAQPQLRVARELDARLQPLLERRTRAEQAREAAAVKHRSTVTELETTIQQRRELKDQQQDHQKRQEELASYAPFADEVSKWQHLLLDAISASADASTAAAELKQATERRGEIQTTLTKQQAGVSSIEQRWQAAESKLRDAESIEREFDVDALVQQRDQCEQNTRLLTTLQQQLKERHRQRIQAETLSAELEQLQGDQETQSKHLAAISQKDLPEAELSVSVARKQLQIIQATLDDQAKRLRAELQEKEPCPVCGSTAHPFQQHGPDADSAAVVAAQQNVSALEEARLALTQKLQRLQLSIDAGAKRLEEQRTQRTEILDSLRSTQFDNSDTPVVADVLALSEEHRIDSVLQRLVECRAAEDEARQQLSSHQQAAKVTRECHEAERAAREALETARQTLETHRKMLSAADVEIAAMQTKLQSATERQQTAAISLGELWSRLPDSSNRFDEDPQQFCDQFVALAGEYRQLATELAQIESNLNSNASRLDPLRHVAEQAKQALEACESEYEQATQAQQELATERGKVLAGRSADEVESELDSRHQVASESVGRLSEIHHEADKTLQAAQQSLQSATATLESSTTALMTADNLLAAWQEDFRKQQSAALTMEELSEMLARDQDWIASASSFLKQVDDAVTRASSTLQDREQQIQKQLAARPTDLEEADIVKALEALQLQLKKAKNTETTAAAELASDDKRRQQNAALTERLVQRQEEIAPWLKLNELIGSKEGDKFRMIAQRRTLDILLTYANHQLSLLAARYRLERLPESLNLIVVDEHMGDERRSVHSLSGGESFLVSLSLALGLASLTSSRMKIESLFIDEGFGSLDAETLDTAMHALMHLEAQGRRIGVISHVAEMQETIPVQVRVASLRSGASRIMIPWDEAEPEQSQSDAKESSSAPLETDALAQQIVDILQREQQRGKHKVSTRALRTELGCEAPQFRAAQNLLDGRVTLDGRSLRLL